LRVKCANGAPDFVALRVEENKSGREFKTVYGGKFHADSFLDIQADNVEFFTDADFVINFLFKLVNGGLNLGAGNSERRLEFQQDGCACADHCLYLFGVIHERCLTRMQNNPGCDQGGNDDPECEEIIPFWFVREQHVTGCDSQPKCNDKEGIFPK
jgi:hypothetical protein